MNPRVAKGLLERAGDVCECGCGKPFGDDNVHRRTVDHFFGRAKADEAVETCWMLRWGCHRLKTDNEPDAGTWLLRFIKHCERYGYAESRRMAMQKLEWLTARKGAAAHV